MSNTIKSYGATQGTKAEKKPLITVDEESKSFSIEDATHKTEVEVTIVESNDFEFPQWMLDFVPTGTMVMYFYLLLGVVCIIFIILGSLGTFTGQLKWIPLIIIEIGLFLGSLSAAYGVYRWGTIDDQTNRLSKINSELEEENKRLSMRLEVLDKNTDVIANNLELAEQKVFQLRQTLQNGLKPIKDQLSVDLKGGSKEARDFLKKFNDIFFKIERDALEQEKYAFIERFFRADIDDIPGLSKDEYNRFLTQLLPVDRDWFKSKGTFEILAGSDNLLDKQEFFHLVDELMKFRAQERIKARFRLTQ